MLTHLSPSEVESLLSDMPKIPPSEPSMMFFPSFDETQDAPPKKRCRSTETNEDLGPSSSGLSREARVLKTVEQVTSAFPKVDFDRLLTRLSDAENVETEADRIIAEISDEPGPSSSNKSGHASRCSPELTPEVAEAAAFLNENDGQTLIRLCQVFPDADPLHVSELINQADNKNIDVITDQMMKNGYRALRIRKDQENKERRRAMFVSGEDFNPAEFLKIYPNPDEYFLSDQRINSDLYNEHAIVFLCNRFRDMREDFFKKLLPRHDNKLLPTYRDIMESEERSKGPSNRRKKRKNYGFLQFLKEHRTITHSYPDKMDETFFREMQYCLNENVVKDYLRNKEEERNRKIENARATNQLVECPICLDDEVLPDEIVRCDRAVDEHSFCRPCTKQHAETQIGNGAHFVRCMADDCDAGRLTLGALQMVLEGKTLQLLVKRAQQDELRSANLANMDSCPFCDFAMIIDNELERLFRCLNPECLRESCRECREPSHIPLRCDEVEQDEETKMRTFIENRMAEAMIRKCPKCQKPIIKSEGCNKMACPCGAYFCYVCNVELSHANPYAHFGQGTKCPQSTPIQQLHDDVAKKAGEEAKALFRIEHSVGRTRPRPPKEVDIDGLVDNAAKTVAPKTAPEPFVFGFLPIIPAAPPQPPARIPTPPLIALLRRQHTQVRERLAFLRLTVTTNQLVEDYDAKRQLIVEIDYEIARCDGEPPTREVVDALIQSAEALNNQWQRLRNEHRDGVLARIGDYRRYATQLSEEDCNNVLQQLTDVEQAILGENHGQQERAIADFNLLMPNVERMVNDRVRQAEANDQARKEVPLIELIDDDEDHESVSPIAVIQHQPISNSDRQQLEKLKSSLKVFDRVLIDLNQRLEVSDRDEQSRRRITNRLDKAIASRWQVLNRMEELQNRTSPNKTMVDDKNAGGSTSVTQAAKLKQVEVLREQTSALNAQLHAAQKNLAKATPMTGESRAALSEVKRLLNERDQSLKRVQEVEAALLRNGASEDDLVGRRDDDQLRLDEQEIQGAADEAGRLAHDATAKREAEQRKAIEQKPVDLTARPAVVPKPTIPKFMQIGAHPLTPMDMMPSFLTQMPTTSPAPPPPFPTPYPTLMPLPEYPQVPQMSQMFNDLSFPAGGNYGNGNSGYWNMWRNNWMAPPPTSPFAQALAQARNASDLFGFRTAPQQIGYAIVEAVQTALACGLVFSHHNLLVATSYEFLNSSTAECGRRLFDLFFQFFAVLCQAAGVEVGDKRTTVAGEWEQFMVRLEKQARDQEERDIAERLRHTRTEIADLLAERTDLQARLKRNDDDLREAQARRTELDDELRAAQARNRLLSAPIAPGVDTTPRPESQDLTTVDLTDRKPNASPGLSALVQKCVDSGHEKDVKQILEKFGSRKRRSAVAFPLLTISSDESDDDHESDIIYEATTRRKNPLPSSPLTVATTSCGHVRADDKAAEADKLDQPSGSKLADCRADKMKQPTTADDGADTPKEASNAATDGSDDGPSDRDDDEDDNLGCYFSSMY